MVTKNCIRHLCVLSGLALTFLTGCGSGLHPTTITTEAPSTGTNTFALGFSSTSGKANYSGALSVPGQALVVNSKLIVSDTDNNRILIWNSLPTASLQAADVVLGATSTIDLPAYATAASATNLNLPGGLASDNTKLIVADTGWNRVLIWNAIPTTSGTPPDVVIGQSNFVSSSINAGAGTTPTALGLNAPAAVYIHSGKLYVGDASNNRVLVYNTIPTTSGAAANFALGQADLVHGVANRSGAMNANTLSNPTFMTVAGTKLVVSDSFNNRVLLWNDVTTIGAGSAADRVIGQNDFSSPSISAAGLDGLSTPYGVDTDGTKLFIADAGNSRVLIFNTIPAFTGTSPSADIFLGQPTAGDADFNQGLSYPQAGSINQPMGITYAGGKLYLADTWNNRILTWAAVPTTSQTAADAVLGQTDMKRAAFSQTLSGITATSFLTPFGSFSDGAHFFVADTGNHRVLIYNSLPDSSSATPAYVLGQSDFVSGDPNRGGSIDSSTLNSPTAVYSDGTNLYVADTGNNRVLKWNAMPTSSGVGADVVIGQPDSATITQGRSNAKLTGPSGVTVAGNKLFVSDQGNARVMIWNTIPTATGAGASVTIGAQDANSTPSGSHPDKEFIPGGVCSDGTRVLISDISGYRVLGWNSIPTADYTAANFALGQADVLSRADAGPPSLTHVESPYGVTIAGGKLYVAEETGRIKIWDALTGANGQAATHFFGQATATVNSVISTPSASYLGTPRGMSVVGARMAITDTRFNRVLFVPFASER